MITAVAFFAWLTVMGFDTVRRGWSHVPWWLQGVGACLLLASFAVFFATFRENRFLSPAVRLQNERAHQLIDSGPYRHVRHPMYSGFVLFALGTALILGSRSTADRARFVSSGWWLDTRSSKSACCRKNVRDVTTT